MKQSHYNISVVNAGILILGQHSFVCTAKVKETSSCEKIFEVADIFVLKLTLYQHTILTVTESSENHGFSKNFLGNRCYLIRSSSLNQYWANIPSWDPLKASHQKTLRFSGVLGGPKGKIGSIWVNVRKEILEQFLISSIFSITVFQKSTLQ